MDESPHLWRELTGTPGRSPIGHVPGTPRPASDESAVVHSRPADQTDPIQISDIHTSTHPHIEAIEIVPDIIVLPQHLADVLPQADSDGLRHGKRGNVYVDLENEGTLMVRAVSSGEYQATSPGELTPSGPVIERNTGKRTWRRKSSSPSTGEEESRLEVTQSSRPDDSKRPRPASPDQETPLNVDETLWDPSADYLDIAGSRYKQIPRGSAPDEPIIYLQHPAQARYDYTSFEDMLNNTPWQQPRDAIRVPPGNEWQVSDVLPFQKPLTLYVADSFPELTQFSLQTVSRRLFYLADHSELATGTGLTVMRQTFNDWKTKNRVPRPELADPLLMLPILDPDSPPASRVHLPHPFESNHLKRLDFDPQLFPDEWGYFKLTQSAVELKRFMQDVLTRNGYVVFPHSAFPRYPVLVFRRAGHDYVFFLQLSRAQGRTVQRFHTPLTALEDSNLEAKVGTPARLAVMEAHAANRLVWLHGGSHEIARHWSSVFIIRHG